MGNTGRSSTGCFRCRKRKVKCDERRQGGCTKCERIRESCPGYPFLLEIDIGDTSAPIGAALPQIQYAAGTKMSTLPTPPRNDIAELNQSTKWVRPVPQHDVDDDCRMIKCCCATVTAPSMSLPPCESPVAPPTYDILHQSTCFFLNLFCYRASALYGAPLFDYLPTMLSDVPPNHCLHLSINAVSRMTLADRYSGNDRRLLTGKDYVQALSAAKTAIRDSDEAVRDETVVAVWLLSLYEALNNVLSYGQSEQTYADAEEEWQSHISHIKGAMYLLKIRGKSQFSSKRAEKIYRIFKAAIQMRLFMLNSITSRDFVNLEQDIYQDDHEFLPSRTAIIATTYFHEAARIVERMGYTLRGWERSSFIDPQKNELPNLMQEAEMMDASMQGWSKAEPGWDLMKVRTSAEGTEWINSPSHALYYFHSFWVYLYWIRYLIARVKLYEGLIMLIHKQRHFCSASPPLDTLVHQQQSISEFKLSQYKTIVQLTTGHIIGLTAYALGDISNSGSFVLSSASQAVEDTRQINVVASMQLVIPLKVLQRSDVPTAVQQGAIDRALSYIADGFRR